MGGLLGGGGGSKAAPPPTPAPVQPMPDTDSPEVLAAKRRAQAAAQARSGRASTLLGGTAGDGGSDFGGDSMLGKP